MHKKQIRVEVVVIKAVHVNAKRNSYENLFAFWPQLIKHAMHVVTVFVYYVYCAFAMACLPPEKTTKWTTARSDKTYKLNPALKISVKGSARRRLNWLSMGCTIFLQIFCTVLKVALTFRRWSEHNTKPRHNIVIEI